MINFLPGVKTKTATSAFFRSAAFCSALCLLSACAMQMAGAKEQWAAHGYLTPGPTSEPELIGVYDNRSECDEAAEAWTTRQVVGNPIFAECYPVDRN